MFIVIAYLFRFYNDIRARQYCLFVLYSRFLAGLLQKIDAKDMFRQQKI
jgi:hypothetical protein